MQRVRLKSAVLIALYAGMRLTAVAQLNLPSIYKALPADQLSLSKSGIPVRLPTRLQFVSTSDPIYLQLLSLDDTQYRIVLSQSEEPCQGQHVCAYGSLEAGRTPIANDERRPSPVRLTRRIMGSYVPFSCHLYCNEAYITWSQGGFFYSIGIKAGRKRELIEAANSAITGAPLVNRIMKAIDTQ